MTHLGLKTDSHGKLAYDKNNRKKSIKTHTATQGKQAFLGRLRRCFQMYFPRACFFEESTYMSDLHLHILATNQNKGQNEQKRHCKPKISFYPYL